MTLNFHPRQICIFDLKQLSQRIVQRIRLVINGIKGHIHGKKKDDMAKVINNIFSKDTTTARRIIKQILAQNGFTTGDTENEVDVFCERVSELS